MKTNDILKIRTPDKAEILEAIRYLRETKEGNWRNDVKVLCKKLEKLDDPFGDAIKDISKGPVSARFAQSDKIKEDD